MYRTKRKLIRPFFIMIVLVLFILQLAGCGAGTSTSPTNSSAPAGDETVYEFNWAHHDPVGSEYGLMRQSFADRVHEATGGRVKINVFGSNTLGAPTDGLTMLETGVCDIFSASVGFFPGQFPACEVLYIPMLGYSNKAEGYELFWDMYEQSEIIQNELSGYKVLGLDVTPLAVLGTKSISISSPADMNGLQIRVTTGPNSKWLNLLNVATISAPASEIYTSLEKNVFDGYVFEWAGLDTYKLQELTGYFLDVPLSGTPSFTLMNLDKWNSLPDDLKAAIDSVIGKENPVEDVEKINSNVQNIIDKAKTDGIVFNVPDDESMTAFNAAAVQVALDWIEENSGKFDSQGLYDLAVQLAAKYR